MRIPGFAKVTSKPMENRSRHWLAALVLLAELPHYLHLPWWVSLFGAAVVIGRILHTENHNSKPGAFLLAPGTLAVIALLTAIAVRVHYGYFLGRDPCVAFLFLLISLKFAESKVEKDATLVICLSGFLLLTQYFYSQTIISAIVSLPAVLVLGGTLLSLRENRYDLSVRTSLLVTGKLLLQGAPIAAALFILFPRLPGPLWSLPNDATGTTGLSDSMAPGSISTLSLSDAVAFRVDFDNAPPAAKDLYWRGPVLSVFDGRQWTAATRQAPTFPEQLQTSSFNNTLKAQPDIGYTVTLEPHRRKWLFALDVPSSLPSRDNLNATAIPVATMMSDLQLISPTRISSPIRYRQTSSLSSSYTESNPQLIAATQIEGRNNRAELFAANLRVQYPDDLVFIQQLLKWFNEEEFYYTLQPSLLGDQPIDEFLFESRRGFCEHYASSFVFLLRAAAIPARVVTGYLGGEMNDSYMIVRQSDAHAWTEAWINGAWHRFDPTAAVAPTRVLDGLAASVATGEPVPALARLEASWAKSMSLRWDAINHDWQRLVIDFNNDSQNRFWHSLGFPTPAAWQITALILIISALWCWFALGLKFKWRKKQRFEDRLWQRYCDRLESAGLPRAATEGPQDYCQRSVQRWPTLSTVFEEFTELITDLRYATPNEARRLQALKDVKSSLNQLPSSRHLRQLPAPRR